VYLLMGAPWETAQSMQKTLDYAKHLYPQYCSFVVATFVVPYPGTDMFQEMHENNLLTTHDWRDYSFGLPVFKMQVPAETAYRLYKKIWMDVYARPAALLEIVKNLFSKNEFDRALAKNFLSMPLQMSRLGKIKTIRDVMPDGGEKESEKSQAASPVDANIEAAETQLEPARETI
jgi:radical SAM superfamily enzyme YgiQ (UPF0313 family)